MGRDIHEKGGIDRPPVILTAKPTPNENYRSKGQLNGLFEDMQKLGSQSSAQRWLMAEPNVRLGQVTDPVTVTGNGTKARRPN